MPAIDRVDGYGQHGYGPLQGHSPAHKMVRRPPQVARIGDGADLLKCSFCGKSQKQVEKLIAGPGVYICGERASTSATRSSRRSSPTVLEVGARGAAEATRDLRVPQRLCRDRSGRPPEVARRRGLQPLQAHPGRRGERSLQRPRQGRCGRARQVQHLDDRPDRLRQDLPCADARTHAQRAVRDPQRNCAPRGRLRR
ncbi:MAG: ClpX C4-type zinc finger protein [Nocardioidaceae bacterium]